MRITSPAAAPAWLAPVVEQVNRAFLALQGSPAAPTGLYAVANAAALAALPPKDNLERLVYVRDIARLAVSNGVNWLRMDTGASL